MRAVDLREVVSIRLLSQRSGGGVRDSWHIGGSRECKSISGENVKDTFPWTCLICFRRVGMCNHCHKVTLGLRVSPICALHIYLWLIDSSDLAQKLGK